MTQTNEIYSIYDRKAQYYLPPFAARSNADATRTFTEAVTTSETPISQYPADFDLVRLGSLDLDTGAITGLHMPELLINGLVALTAAHQQRARYKQILNAPELDIDSPDPS